MSSSVRITTHDMAVAQKELRRQRRRLDLLCLRLTLFRDVRHISPLVQDLLAADSVGLRSLLYRLRPLGARSNWRRWVGHSRRTNWHYLLPRPWQPQVPWRQADKIFRDDLRGRGVVVRPPSHEDGALGIFVSGDQIDVEFVQNGVHVWSHEGGAFLVVRQAFPETVALAIVGSPLEEVVEHPAFVGRGYEITECWVSDVDRDGEVTTTIRFHTGRQPFVMPFGSIVSDLAQSVALRSRKN